MKSIKKIGKAVAGSALLVGATLTGAAGFASAADLGDYPQPFVSDDGEVQSTIVVGASERASGSDIAPAKTIDVVGAVNIAGSLGNAAFKSETKSVSVSGTGGSWSASSGVTLDTRNDNLFYGDNVDTVRQTLTQDDLEVLSETTFTDDDNQDTDITNYLNVGTQSVTFGNSEDGLDDEDPVLHVPNPSEDEVDSSTYLFNLQANFEDSINFSDSAVKGEEIELFGRTYTVSDGDNSAGDSKLVLFGNQDIISIDSGTSKTVTINDEEVTFEVVSVTDSDTAAIRVNGDLSEEDEGDTFNVNDQEVRVDNIIKTGGSNSDSGVVDFAIGSEELRLEAGNPVEDSNGDDIEGTHVQFDGSNSGDINSISSIDVYVGAQDDDNDYVAAGESFSHGLFENVEFHFGGLAPDASSTGDSVGEVAFSQNGNDDIVVDITADGGDDASINFAHHTGSGTEELGDSDDGDNIVTREGATITEDDYFLADAGDFAHMYEVTSYDVSNSSASDTESGTIDLKDVVTGGTVEVNLDETGDNTDQFTDQKIIDGQAYHFQADGSANDFNVTWGTNSDFSDTGAGTTNGATTLFAPLDLESGGAVTFADGNTTTGQSAGTTLTYELPSTESTDAAEVNVTFNEDGSDGLSATAVNNVNVDDSDSDRDLQVTVNGGQQYQFRNQSSGTLVVEPYNGSAVNTPASVVIESEDDGGDEDAWLVDPSDPTNSDGYQLSGSGNVNYSDGYSPVTMDSDDNTDVSYNSYGTYSDQDTQDEGSFTLRLPFGQSTAGAAFTGSDGELSSSSGGSGSVETQSPTGWPDAAALDSDSNIGSAKTNDNLILVGGPAVNALTQELANDGKTQAASDYSEGSAMVQLVEDAFTSDQDALVVAGYAGEDTREAANYIADYADNSEELAGKNKVSLTTQQTQNAE